MRAPPLPRHLAYKVRKMNDNLIADDGTVSACNLLWRLTMISDALFSDHTQTTLAGFCVKHGIPAVWDEDAARHELIVAKLVELLKPDLDAGEVALSVLDLDPKRRVRGMRDAFYRGLTRVRGRHYGILSNLGLVERDAIDGKTAASIAAKAVELGLDADMFQYLLSIEYVELIQSGLFDEADSLDAELAPSKELGVAQFRPGLIPTRFIDEAYQHSVDSVCAELTTPTALRYAQALVARGVLQQDDLNKKLHDVVLSYLGNEQPLPAVLEPHRNLVRADEIADACALRIRAALSRIRLQESNRDIAPDLALLRGADHPDDEVRQAVKQGYLLVIRKEGNSARAQALALHLTEGQVTAAEVAEAVLDYTDKLAASPSFSQAWLNAAAANRAAFREGAFQRAVMGACYDATYGSTTDATAAAAIRAQFPDMPWSTLELAPPCVFAGVDLRARLTPVITDPMEAALARVLFDWLGSGGPSDAIQRVVEQLKNACLMAVRNGNDGLQRLSSCQGRTATEAVQAMRILCAVPQQQLTSVPYVAILRLQGRIATLVRAFGRDIG